MNRRWNKLLMRCCSLLLGVTFLLSGLLHDRIHHHDGGNCRGSADQVVAAYSAITPAPDVADIPHFDRAGDFCPICAGFLQFFLADGQVEVPLTFITVEKITGAGGIAPSAVSFFHQPRAPPVFSC